MIILMFGAPGTGKSTYSRYQAEKLGVPWISSGQVLRDVALRDEWIARWLASGDLVPDEDAEPVIFEPLAAARRGFVLDGYPRTVSQAKSFLLFLRDRSLRIDRVYHITAPAGVVVSRLQARGREDDSPEVVSERLRVYRTETEPVIEVLKEAGAEIVEVDSSPPMEKVKRQLDASIKDLVQ